MAKRGRARTARKKLRAELGKEVKAKMRALKKYRACINSQIFFCSAIIYCSIVKHSLDLHAKSGQGTPAGGYPSVFAEHAKHNEHEIMLRIRKDLQHMGKRGMTVF